MSSDPNESDRRPPSAPSLPPSASQDTTHLASPVSSPARHYTSMSLLINEVPRDFDNSMLQMLYHTHDIREYLLSCVDKVTGDFHKELARIFKFISSEDSPKCASAQTVHLTRQDAQSAVIFEELLTDGSGQVLGTRRNPINGLVSALVYLDKESNSAQSNNAPNWQRSVHNSTQAWEWYIKFVSNSFVSRLVTVQMEVQLAHLNCGHRTNVWNWDKVIKIRLEKDDRCDVVCSLKNYLDKFMSEQIIMHQCDKCTELGLEEEQECSQIQVLSHAPTYLIVYLLRLFKNGTKLTNRVLINERLDLGDGRVYELVSAITHNGTDCQNGVYWTVVRERHDHWVLLANENVFIGLDNEQAKQLLLRFAYGMMYRLVSGKDPKEAQYEEEEEIRKVLDNTAQDDRNIASDSGHYCGLRNFQFMCYSNSVLQVLYSCAPVRRYLITHARSGPFHRLLAELCVRMERQSLKNNFPLADPELKLNRQFRSVRPEFTPDSMHDAQEYISILMDLVHQEANEAKQNRDKRPKESAPIPANSKDAWAHQVTYEDNSFLSKMFLGQMESVLTCLACGRLSRTWYGVWELPLHLEQEKEGDTRELNLTDCINEFTGEETLKDDCAPICSQCNSRQSATKQQSLYRVPPYLIIHLKRFTSTGGKIYRMVKIDETLNLAAQSLVLSSVVCHSGTESVGHYYTIVREAENQWIELNDETISKMDSATVPDLLKTYAYLCIYKVVSEIKEVKVVVEQEKKIKTN